MKIAGLILLLGFVLAFAVITYGVFIGPALERRKLRKQYANAKWEDFCETRGGYTEVGIRQVYRTSLGSTSFLKEEVLDWIDVNDPEWDIKVEIEKGNAYRHALTLNSNFSAIERTRR